MDNRMNNTEIMVSVCCLVYNHAKYLRECLDGFIMQKTNFKFEVLVHDDASTDGSQDIIREYEEKYPDIIKPIYQTENQHSKKVKINWTYQYPRAKGKYIALCEGDDFWCDENKLQLQFDIMEKDDSISMVTHASNRVNTESVNLNNEINGFNKDIIIDINNYLESMFDGKRWNIIFQTSSFFIRKKNIQEMVNNTPKFVKECNIGDVPITLYSLTKGNIFFINKIMSSYRVGVPGAWTQRKLSNQGMLNQLKNRIDLYSNFKEYCPLVKEELINTYICFYKSQYMYSAQEYDLFLEDVILRKYIRKYLGFRAYICVYIKILLKNTLSYIVEN